MELPQKRENLWTDLSLSEFPVSSNAWSLIALEAWRRGLRVQISEDRYYTISSNETTLPFRLSRLATRPSSRGARICNDKHQTKQYFMENDVPTPSGFHFVAPFDKLDIMMHSNMLGYPICLKANGWSKGKGVYSFVPNEEQLSVYLDELVDELVPKSLIVEEHFPGEAYRFFVVGNTVSGVTKRIPANVVGDGQSTIQQLILRKNLERSKNPYLKGALINVDAEVEYMLQASGRTLESTPAPDETVFLRTQGSASAGGDTIDVTEEVSLQSKLYAIQAINSIPGIAHGGVDILIIDPETSSESHAVIEINQTAEIGLHLYPAFGKPRFPPKDIVDLYFPSYPSEPQNNHWYFDLTAALQPIHSRVAENVTIKPIPTFKKAVWKSLTCTGRVQGVGFRKWLVREAPRHSVHGDARNCGNGDVYIRLTGEELDVERFVDLIRSDVCPADVQSLAIRETTPFRIFPGLRIRT